MTYQPPGGAQDIFWLFWWALTASISLSLSLPVTMTGSEFSSWLSQSTLMSSRTICGEGVSASLYVSLCSCFWASGFELEFLCEIKCDCVLLATAQKEKAPRSLDLLDKHFWMAAHGWSLTSHTHSVQGKTHTWAPEMIWYTCDMKRGVSAQQRFYCVKPLRSG